MNKKTKQITQIALLTALASILYKIEIPMFAHLKIDPSLIPGLVGGVIINPLAGVLIEVFKNLIDLPSSNTMGFGQLINAIVGISVIVPFSLIYKETTKSLVIACITTFVSILTIGSACNYFLTEPFLRIVFETEATHEMIMTYVVASFGLNTTKFFVTVAPTVLIVKALKKSKVY